MLNVATSALKSRLPISLGLSLVAAAAIASDSNNNCDAAPLADAPAMSSDASQHDVLSIQTPVAAVSIAGRRAAWVAVPRTDSDISLSLDLSASAVIPPKASMADETAAQKAAPKIQYPQVTGYTLLEFWNNYLKEQQGPFLGAPLWLGNVDVNLNEKTSVKAYWENFLPGTPGIAPWQPNIGHMSITQKDGGYTYTFGAGSFRMDKWDSPDNVNGFRGNLDQRAFDRDVFWFTLEDTGHKSSYQFIAGKDPFNGKTAGEVIYTKNWNNGYNILTLGSFKGGTAYYRYAQDYGKHWNFAGDLGFNSLGQGGIANLNYKLPNNLRFCATYWNINYNTVWGGENVSQGAGIGVSWGTRINFSKDVSFYVNAGISYNQSFNKFNARPLDRTGFQGQLGGALVFWLNP